MTRDHSHIIFKIDNPIEQKVFDINEDIQEGDLILDPFTAGHVCGDWISKGWSGIVMRALLSQITRRI